MFNNKSILITGGTGSFGSALLSRLISEPIDEIRVFSRDEKKQEDLRSSLNDTRVRFYLGDVRDINSIDVAMAGIDYVFHAAALKQVPSCEFFPLEAIKTNCLGAENVMAAAVKHRVKTCVVLSTDKAVYPINAMGMSKALMEKLMVANARAAEAHGVTLCATRYGNVMGSRGSVIPLFMQQIRTGQIVTITNPSMSRFLMSLSDSVELVLHALRFAEPGDILVQKSPAASIHNLCVAVSQFLDLPANINVIGTRHGEKLFETLVSREEMLRTVDQGRFFVIKADTRDLYYNKYVSEGIPEIDEASDYTSHNTSQLSIDEIKLLLRKL